MVYVVLGGWQYEGCDQDSVQVFADCDAAYDYGAALVAEDAECRYDFYRVVERKVQ